MTTKTGNYSLRMPISLKKAVEEFSKKDNASINQFVVMAVAEKVSALNTAEYFAQRKTRADMDSFDRIMSRESGAPLREDDMLPDD